MSHARPMRITLALVLLLMLLACSTPRAMAQLAPATAPATQPTTRPLTPAELAKREGDRQRLADFLIREYGVLLKSPDWVRRAMAVISYARLPVPQTLPILLETIQKDAHPAVQVLAWEGVMSRCAWLTAEQHKQWVAATWVLARKNVFRGELRGHLLDLLSTIPPDRVSEKAVADLFPVTGTRAPEDLVVLEAMGRCLAAWKSRELADAVVKRLRSPAEAVKAAVVLRAAGFPGFTEMSLTPQGVAECEKWWTTQKRTWKPVASIEGEPWRKLPPGFLPAIPVDAVLDPDEPRWRRELELGRPDVSHFELSFVIDVSGSMTPALQWLRREVAGIMQALSAVAREPRIGLTFFGCRGDVFTVATIPLTGDVSKLRKALTQMNVQGGSEELVLDGLASSIKSSGWVKSDKAAKVMILVGDEEIAPNQIAGAEALVRQAAGQGFKLYALCPGSRIPRTYGNLAVIGTGEAFAVPLPGYEGMVTPGPILAPAEPEPIGTAHNPARRIVTDIVMASINKEFRDRVEPMVAVLLAIANEPAQEAANPSLVLPPRVR